MKLLKYSLFCFLISWSFPHISLPIFAKENLPILTVSSPKDGNHILGNKITVSFVIGNFTFRDFNQKKVNTAKEGHLHLWLDIPLPTKLNALEIISNENYLIQNIAAGTHTLKIEVVQNDHSSFPSPISYRALFNTTLPFPTASPTPLPFTTSLTQQLPKEYLFTALGILLFIIGFILYFQFGRKKFLKD